MKILITKTSDWNYKKIIEIKDIMELKQLYHSFVINFDIDYAYYRELGKIDFEAIIYDSYKKI